MMFLGSVDNISGKIELKLFFIKKFEYFLGNILNLKANKEFVVLSITYTIFILSNISLTLYKKYKINSLLKQLLKELGEGSEFLEDFVEKI